MKILYLFRSLAVFGGIERILVDKMNYLSSVYGYSVWMITTDQSNHAIPYHLDEDVKVEDLGICFYRQYNYNIIRRIWVSFMMKKKYRDRLHRRIMDINPDVVVCTTADDINSIVRVKGVIPLVVESHSIFSRTIEYGNYWLLKKFRKYMFLKTLSSVDCLVSLTEADGVEWRKVHPKVVVIPNFIFVFGGERALLNNKSAIFVGRLDYQKAPLTVISIWSKIRQRDKDWILHIYGEGDLEDEVKKLAEEVGGIIVHKPTDNIWKCYAECSMLLSTSLFEPFGLVLIEAMSCGLPVVAFDCPYGPSAIISDGINGYIVSKEDIDGYVEKVLMLMGSIGKRQIMGKAGRISISRYAPSSIMPQWKLLFEEIRNKKVI
ncbi:Glycosyltransferase involved in cell wall bisynthesis [Prevotella sp. khp1]|uniref:glycosyltransferase n=1 Tax=Prevotellaceae TaxID=171552 RepID=UPI0008853D70|nr:MULTISPECIES: glycosyltransferase [Prevotellaceae]QVJ80691.1 glycosyltransferase [Xylanibacter ruminicola]SDQ15919.1 Glycosyltransferase involved in cell wall bisynthesis [Prevotella sp. khp1]